MSSPFPKSKEKRPRSPSEPNNSFVKNVTSRMSGLLPATITKWFSSPSSSNTNGSAQAADATDSSTEDEAPESPSTIQPPAKRTRYNPPGEISQRAPVETRCTSTNTESIDEIYTAHSPIGRTSSGRKNIFASTRIHAESDDTTADTTQDSFYKAKHSISTIEQPVTKKRKSLFGNPEFDHKKHDELKNASVRDPYFKPSLLYSPFYVGRTMYGGASSSYLSPSSFKKKTVSVTSETSNNDSVNMSHSARRVMDLLEHYSSPLIEAKRIPQITRTPVKQNINDSLSQPVNPYTPKPNSYKFQELHVPSVASILTMKRKSRLMDSTNAARQIIASHSSSSPQFSPYPTTNSGGDASDEISGDRFTTKLKSRKARPIRDRHIEMETGTADTVNLPNVVLQIDKDNLPKFTFGAPQSSSIQTPVIITPEAFRKNSETDKSDFSKQPRFEKEKPMERPISSDSDNTPSTPKFIFGSPDRQVSKINEKAEEMKAKDDNNDFNTSNQVSVGNRLTVQKTSDWKCMDCLVMNKVDVDKCVCCGWKKPDEIDVASKKCSKCSVSISQSQSDKCTNCEKAANNVVKPLVEEKAKSAKWKCNDCWVDNPDSAVSCVCCGGKRVQANQIKIKTAAVINSEATSESEWKCNDCWIKNKSSLNKCAACGGAKPGSQSINVKNVTNNEISKASQGEKNFKETLDGTLSKIAKSQSERWECPICLVRNPSDKNICVCCDASKPGTEKETVKFNFHQPSEITFKFGIQLKQQEQSSNIETEECNMAEESETNNNVLPKTSTFSFGLPVKKPEGQSPLVDKLAEAPKINFTFGVPKGDSMSPIKNNIFGIPNKPVETTKNVDEKPQEVPQVFTSPQSDEQVKNNTVAPEMSGLVPLSQMNQNSAPKKDVSFLNPSATPATSSETTTPQNNFTFPKIMPATNLFTSTPTTTASMSNMLSSPLSMATPASTTMSLFQKPNVATTTTSSFFQKSDSVPALGASLFSKSESTTTTTTTTSQGPTMPIFSFGSQGTTAPQAEKPKFSFNFSSNKTESTPLFKPTFGTTSDSGVTSNNFNLPSNSILGGNTLSGSALNSTAQMNPLTTGNSLATPLGPSIFGATVPKENNNMWTSSTNNLFTSNTTTNTNGDQEPRPFTFGTSTPFSANSAPFGSPARTATPFGSTTQSQQNNTPFGSTAQQAQPSNTPFGIATTQQPSNPAFGSTIQQSQPTPAFGSATQPTPAFGSATQPTPAFGSSTQTQPNNTAFGSNQQQSQTAQAPVFGIGNQTTTSQPTMFGTPMQNQTAPSMFGTMQVPNANPMPMGMFGTPNQVTPSFGSLNPQIPAFQSSVPPPQPAPASFNFGGQSSTSVFGFGQQQQQSGQAPAQPEGQPQGMYGFGAPNAAPQMQFTIGSAPNTNVRRVRKAMRRTQR